jgi:putative PIN family toxin of toxin-antitoxin system
VLDTSVLVSAVISPTGSNSQVFDLVVAKKIKACLTDAVLDEYTRVFEYERLKHLDGSRMLAYAACWKPSVLRSNHAAG